MSTTIGVDSVSIGFILGVAGMPSESDTAPSEPRTRTHCLGYRLVEDNTDLGVKARYIRVKGTRNESLHYFHSFALSFDEVVEWHIRSSCYV